MNNENGPGFSEDTWPLLAYTVLLWADLSTVGLNPFFCCSPVTISRQLDMHEQARSAWRKPLYLSRGVFLLGLMITAQIESVAGVN